MRCMILPWAQITLACIAIMLLWERPFIKTDQKHLPAIPGPLLAALGTVFALFNSHQSLALNGQHFVGRRSSNGSAPRSPFRPCRSDERGGVTIAPLWPSWPVLKRF